jgi:hypothetical protein
MGASDGRGQAARQDASGGAGADHFSDPLVTPERGRVARHLAEPARGGGRPSYLSAGRSRACGEACSRWGSSAGSRSAGGLSTAAPSPPYKAAGAKQRDATVGSEIAVKRWAPAGQARGLKAHLVAAGEGLCDCRWPRPGHWVRARITTGTRIALAAGLARPLARCTRLGCRRPRSGFPQLARAHLGQERAAGYPTPAHRRAGGLPGTDPCQSPPSRTCRPA